MSSAFIQFILEEFASQGNSFPRCCRCQHSWQLQVFVGRRWKKRPRNCWEVNWSQHLETIKEWGICVYIYKISVRLLIIAVPKWPLKLFSIANL